MLSDIPPNLDAYFERIGYGGSTEPTVATLSSLLRSHLATIPFESLDAFLHREVKITPEAIDAKLIARRRGGMCFEHASLFRRVLNAIGYEVTSLNARGLVGEVRPRAHHVMRVIAEGEDWLVEVGNGAATPTAPLQWRYGIPQETPHGAFRLTAAGIETVLEEERDGIWIGSYSVSPDPHRPEDFLPANWWATAHPTSFYRAYLVCTLAPANSRILLFNNRLTLRCAGERDATQVLDADGLEKCLTTVFGLEVEPAWRGALRRAVALGDELGD
jgi:N-hydroxyarylamine O-acetyltransferase